MLWIGPAPVDESMQPFSPAPGISYSFHNGRAAELSGAYGAVATALDVPFFDLHAALIDDRRYLNALRAGDGVHPAARGYTAIAKRVEEWPAWRAWFDGAS